MTDGRQEDGLDDPGRSLRALYDQHYRPMVKLASFYVDDVGSCEEVVQDVFVNLVSRRGSEAAGDEVAYLRAAVLNRARSMLRKRRVRRARRAEPTRASGSAEASAVESVADEELLEEIRALPSRQADVLVLRYWLDLSEAEIARTLRIAPGTVKSHSHRGLKKLAERLGDQR